MSELPYVPKILLVEDEEQFYAPVSRWLNEEGYQVRLATSYLEARSALESEHFHLAIVDISLVVEVDPVNEDGMKLLEDMKRLQLDKIMPCIILTGNASKERILKAWKVFDVYQLVEKQAGYRKELLKAVRESFAQEVHIKFNLEYVGGSEKVLKEVAKDVNWSMAEKPSLKLLTPQVRDLFGKLFSDAKSLFVSKLKPGLTGAAVVRVQPTWDAGLGRAYVAKIGRRDKVETESQRYEENVKRYLPTNTVTQVGADYTRHIGALLYTFAENERVALIEFDEYYNNSQPEAIIESMNNLFQNTCRYWYEARERIIEDLTQLYYSAFRLDQKKLVGRIQMVLPQFDPEAATFRFSPEATAVPNPIAWLNKYRDECVLPVYRCITHGDLTGRNIMVDETGKCWLIDFYRTYPSHILRDFVILETDIKYRLMSLLSQVDFLKLEDALLEADRRGQRPVLDSELSKDVHKAAQVIYAVRKLAHEYSRGLHAQPNESRKEYLISLLMATLNVVRLRHISEIRKLQAMHSAVMICGELDKLAGRQPAASMIDMYVDPVLAERTTAMEDSSFFAPALMTATAQQRFLAENLSNNNVILFVGSEAPQNEAWPGPADLARQLMKEIDYVPSASDKPTKLFAFYTNKIGNREKLIDQHVAYYDEAERPSLYRRAIKLQWQAIYTTNQHTYLEQAFAKKNQKYEVHLTLPADGEVGEDTAVCEKTPIYKIYGSLAEEHRQAPTSVLPITEYDHRQRETVLRVQQFWQHMGQSVKKGAFLLMLCASEEELMAAYQYCQPDAAQGLIWITGGDYSEEEQDVYRNLDFRVLPNQPSELLKVLYTLISVGTRVYM